MLNAFFMSMRSKFTSADATIHYYVVEFDPKVLSCADFRGKVLQTVETAIFVVAQLARPRSHAGKDWPWAVLRTPEEPASP